MGNVLLSAWGHCDLAGKFDLVILGLLSLYSWYIMIGKFFLFKGINKKHNLFETYIRRRKSPLNIRSPLHATLNYGIRLIKSIDIPDEKILLRLENFAEREIEKLEKNLSFLATIVSIAPFLGLLGTVWGLLLSFNNMAIAGTSSIKIVASGVAEALITTIVGLIVAIPAAIGHNYFMEKLKHITGRIEFLLPYIISFLKKNES